VRYRILKIIAMVLVAVLVFAGSVAAATWLNINNAVQSGKIRSLIEGESDEDAYLDPNSGKPINFVLIGQDTRDGDGNGDVSGDGATEGGLHNADTTMVVQIGADRNYVNLVSIPRDSLVDVPACHTSKETIPAQYGVQFNSIFANAYSVGGDLSSAASCTVNAVNALTGLHISNFIVVDFNGLSKMIDSIDGVDLCFPSDV
ncbi:transcriptional regulator, partial [Limosilactobacillus reuteri]